MDVCVCVSEAVCAMCPHAVWELWDIYGVFVYATIRWIEKRCWQYSIVYIIYCPMGTRFCLDVCSHAVCANMYATDDRQQSLRQTDWRASSYKTGKTQNNDTNSRFYKWTRARTHTSHPSIHHNAAFPHNDFSMRFSFLTLKLWYNSCIGMFDAIKNMHTVIFPRHMDTVCLKNESILKQTDHDASYCFRKCFTHLVLRWCLPCSLFLSHFSFHSINKNQWENRLRN